MKKFIQNILLFLIPFIIGFIFIYFVPYSKEYGYGYRNNIDCNTSWIYYRLFENPTPIDIAFMGTSHTGCGINDSLIETKLHRKFSLEKNIVNMSYCSNGRNMHYSLLKDLLENKKPEIIVLEITEEENKSSHKDFPYVADIKDVARAPFLSNSSYLSDLYTSLSCHFNYFRHDFLNTLNVEPPANYQNDNSYVPFIFFADSNMLKEHQIDQEESYHDYNESIFKKFKLQHPKEYIEKFIKLADSYNTPVVFLYIPSFSAYPEVPVDYEYYKALGNVWIPPKSIFMNYSNWVDKEHLNYEGTKELGDWLSQKIGEELEKH